MKHPYKVVHLAHTNGCDTKFKPGRYISATPSGAAKKAASQLCSHKRISGRCSLVVSVVRTDLPKDKRKVMSYTVRRVKLAKPMKRMVNGKEIVNKYKLEAKAHKKALPKCKDGKKTSGPMKKKRVTRGGTPPKKPHHGNVKDPKFYEKSPVGFSGHPADSKEHMEAKMNYQAEQKAKQMEEKREAQGLVKQREQNAAKKAARGLPKNMFVPPSQ